MKLSSSEGINNQSDLLGLKRITQVFAKAVELLVNGNITFKDNLRGKTVDASFLAANTDTQVNHGLTFIPSGYIVTSKDSGFVVYNGSVDVFTKTFVTLRASAIGNAQIWIY